MPRAKYTNIVGWVRKRIVLGEVAPGDRLPSERVLAKEWGVARPTVSRAVREMRHLGLIESRNGVGHFVATPPTEADPAALRRRLEAIMRWLIDDGQMTPLAERQIVSILDAEGVCE